MANRAYLFFTDDVAALSHATRYKKPDGSEREYFDSRHQLPLAWLLFFSPESLVLEPVTYMNSTWQEPYLVRNWNSARADFLRRVPLFLSWFEGEFTREDVDIFWSRVASHANAYLVCDPNELEYEGREDRLRAALATLDDDTRSSAEKFAALDAFSYVSEASDADERRKKVFGFGYGPPQSGYFLPRLPWPNETET